MNIYRQLAAATLTFALLQPVAYAEEASAPAAAPTPPTGMGMGMGRNMSPEQRQQH